MEPLLIVALLIAVAGLGYVVISHHYLRQYVETVRSDYETVSNDIAALKARVSAAEQKLVGP